NDVFSVLTDLLGLVRVFPETATNDPQLLRRAPAKIYRQYGFFPVSRDHQRVVVAFMDPLNQQHVEAARKYFGQDLVVGIASRKSVTAAIARSERDPTGSGTSIQP